MTAFLDILLALFLGICLGLERSFAKKTAGMRTYALVSMGACLFIILSRLASPLTDPGSPGKMYVLQGLIMGIGFIGGGAILHNKEHTVGLTTAAGLWITAGIGAAVGFGYASLAVFTTIVTLFAFTVLWFIEHYITGEGEERPDATENR
ncbi:MAG: methyltransferase [Parcubacteria group bacterium]|nr:methyltransferase [Parcubacteria group bacterium]